MKYLHVFSLTFCTALEVPVRIPYPVNVTNAIHGIVEVKHNGEWGTLCFHEDGNEHNSATVLCRMMGYRYGLASNLYATGSDRKSTRYSYWLHSISCYGNETNINDCGRSTWGNTESDNCYMDSSILCSNTSKHDLFKFLIIVTLLYQMTYVVSLVF